MSRCFLMALNTLSYLADPFFFSISAYHFNLHRWELWIELPVNISYKARLMLYTNLCTQTTAQTFRYTWSRDFILTCPQSKGNIINIKSLDIFHLIVVFKKEQIKKINKDHCTCVLCLFSVSCYGRFMPLRIWVSEVLRIMRMMRMMIKWQRVHWMLRFI